MKGKRSLLIGVVIGGVIGWAVGYMRLPYMNSSRAFWVGAVAALALILLFLFVLFLWRQPTFLTRWMFKSSNRNSTGFSLFGIVTSLLLVVGLGSTAFLLYQKNKALAQQNKENLAVQQKTMAVNEAFRKSNQSMMMGLSVQDVEFEASRHPEHKISQASIAQIASLAYACEPYQILIGDSLTASSFSPEKGKLLLSLAFMELDSTSFAQVKDTTSFALTYLPDADLSGTDLSGIDLSGANLRGANLEGANLRGADLRTTDLWGARLNGADLTGAIMNQVNLQWAELKGTNLTGAILNGAVLKNAQFIKANLQYTQLQWAFCDGAMFNDADFRGADMEGTLMQRTNLTNANLSKSSLRRVDLTEANLKDANVDSTSVAEQDWLDKLTTWKTINSSYFQDFYQVVDDTSGRFKFGSLCLERITP